MDGTRAQFLVENAELCQLIAINLGVWRLFRLRKLHDTGEQ